MATITQEHRPLAVETPLGEDALVLVSLTGHEEMSRLFCYRLEMVSEQDSIPAKKIVGKSVTFRINLADGTPRCFNGVVSRFSAGDRETGLRHYHAEVVPWLWLLTRTTDCRIFQNKSVPDIVEQIFKDLGFSDYSLQLKGTHKPREYCVQYRETDFNFVSRLMEEEGIFYFFQHAHGKHTLVLADHPGAYKDLPEKEVEYAYSYGTLAGPDRLTSWEHQYEFISGKWAQTDYNFEEHPARGEATPSKLLMTNEKSAVPLDNVDKFELYDYPGEYVEKDVGRALTKVRMEEVEATHDVVRAASWCRSFTPGGKFKVTRHDCREEEGKGYVITSIDHTARQLSEYDSEEKMHEAYQNRFTCIPDSVPFRPQRTTPRPVVRGVQPAVVVGPAGEEIYTDKHGRVKVQFFWDREGKRDESSSCWVRVSQSYAGKGWGSVTIPRIGQEVIVDFVEGDPDHPIIVGRVYNADQTPPYPLPGKKMVSGLKSNSTPGGGGYNEYIMDDTKGNELIREHGQFDKDSTIEHDLREHVLNNRSRDVTGNETISVGKNRSASVGGSESLSVAKDQSVSIGGNRTESVGKDEKITISGNRTESVGKDESITISGSRTESVGKNDSLTVGRILAINAGDEITLTTGAASISMKKDGTISIKGKDILITGSGKITAKASGDMVLKGSKISQN